MGLKILSYDYCGLGFCVWSGGLVWYYFKNEMYFCKMIRLMMLIKKVLMIGIIINVCGEGLKCFMIDFIFIIVVGVVFKLKL